MARPRSSSASRSGTTGAPENASDGCLDYALLRDGTSVAIREPRESDLDAVYRLHAALTPESRYLRFFGVPNNAALSGLAHRICLADGAGRGALVATRGERIIGVAQYDSTGQPGCAEVSMAVADDTRRRGVGTLLLEHLASHARSNGIREFRADVLLTNGEMMGVFAAAGLPMQRQVTQGEIHVTFPLTTDERYLTATHEREGLADRASLDGLLRPSSVAVIGAGRRAGSVGRAVLHNIGSGGFTGSLYAVNPHASHIDNVPAFPSVTRLPETPDLAVVAVPAAAVLDVAWECAHRGVRGLVIITGGLDLKTQQALRTLCRTHDMRLVGPNCFGMGNTEEGIRLDATFGATHPVHGSAGVVVQSGGVGITVLDHLSRLGVGISSFVSLGDKVDVSGNDLLMWWDADEATRLGVLYLESFGNPRKFSWLARQVGRRIPLLTVAAGQSEPGQRAAASHTAAAATSARTTRALFHQAGIVTTRDLGELVGTAALLAHQPLPQGPRVGIVTNAGGAGVLAADACVAAGLTVRSLGGMTRQGLTAALPARAECANPVDTGADATSSQFHTAVRTLAASPDVDAVIVLTVATALTELDPATMAPQVAQTGKPVLAVALGQAETVTAPAIPGGPPLPCYGDPTAAARALGHAWQYSRWRAHPRGEVPHLSGVAAEPAREAVETFLAGNPDGGWLPTSVALALCANYGIPIMPWRWARSPREAGSAARDLGGRIAVKAEIEGVVHKGREGALRLNLGDPAAVVDAYRELQQHFGDRMHGALVQCMATPGLELLFGVHHDPVFGPVLVYGLGGVHADALDLRQARLTPLTTADAAELIATLPATAPENVPGKPESRRAAGLDTSSVENIALRLSQLATDLPEVAELDLNPVIVTEEDCQAVDVRIRVEPVTRTDPYLRRLP
ncbi:GNAT family N-acetyltransferase [Lipingzhangella sp. LS1_29]|uniref:GNAT family N-acetyltransferase n=1 Tax=Lipingzhangella rawalii TaxID=2055835 RepID=A0ABU2HCT3_9ACTN|nr:GNAT family N-acetyltransferase [Lipingzhangella rawalii]MDS1272374.1 GNAT family N-acetyltransferase [Lipingzhangella rawalii]